MAKFKPESDAERKRRLAKNARQRKRWANLTHHQKRAIIARRDKKVILKQEEAEKAPPLDTAEHEQVLPTSESLLDLQPAQLISPEAVISTQQTQHERCDDDTSTPCSRPKRVLTEEQREASRLRAARYYQNMSDEARALKFAKVSGRYKSLTLEERKIRNKLEYAKRLARRKAQQAKTLDDFGVIINDEWLEPTFESHIFPNGPTSASSPLPFPTKVMTENDLLQQDPFPLSDTTILHSLPFVDEFLNDADCSF